MNKAPVFTSPFTNDATHAAYLEKNRIAVGPPSDPEEFLREYEPFKGLLPKRNPLRVLDISCGTGAWSVLCATRGCKFTGADFDAECVARARLREHVFE